VPAGSLPCQSFARTMRLVAFPADFDAVPLAGVSDVALCPRLDGDDGTGRPTFMEPNIRNFDYFDNIGDIRRLKDWLLDPPSLLAEPKPAIERARPRPDQSRRVQRKNPRHRAHRLSRHRQNGAPEPRPLRGPPAQVRGPRERTRHVPDRTDLLVGDDEDAFEMNNGGVCRAVRDDLARII